MKRAVSVNGKGAAVRGGGSGVTVTARSPTSPCSARAGCSCTGGDVGASSAVSRPCVARREAVCERVVHVSVGVVMVVVVVVSVIGVDVLATGRGLDRDSTARSGHGRSSATSTPELVLMSCGGHGGDSL